MSHEENGESARADADFAQAFKDLQRGEQTAAALESHLDSLEKKIEELLAQAEKVDQERKAQSTPLADKATQNNGQTSP